MRAVEQPGLLECVLGNVGTEGVQRLLGQDQHVPVGHDGRIRQPLDSVQGCPLHRVSPYNLVAQQEALRVIRRDLVVPDRHAAGEAGAGEAGEPEVGRAGDDALVERG